MSGSGGVQNFDGRTFRQVPVTTDERGIQQDKWIKFFRLNNGNILLSSTTTITEYSISTNRFRQLIRVPSWPGGGTIHVLAEKNKQLWVWLRGYGIACFDQQKLAFTDTIFLNRPGATHRRVNPDEHLLPIIDGNRLYIADVSNGTIDSLAPTMAQSWFYSALLYSKNELLVATTRGIELLNYSTRTFRLLINYKNKPGTFNLEHPVQLKMTGPNSCLVSEGNELFELDISTGQYTARLMSLQNLSFTSVGYFTGMHLDDHQNLWLLTENNGIRKINYRFSGFRYFSDPNSKNNFVKTVFADKAANRILCGLFGGGLQVYDTSQQLIRSITAFPGETAPTVCAFYKTAPDRYLVFLMGRWDIYEFNAVNFSLRKMPLDVHAMASHVQQHRFVDYHLTLLPYDSSAILLQNSFYLYQLKGLASGSLAIAPVDTFPTATVSSYCDPANRIWVGGQGKYYLFANGAHHYRTFDVPGNAVVRCFYRDDDGHTWMGTENGLYRLRNDGTISRFYGLADGLPDINIYAIREDGSNNTWFSHNKGISCRTAEGQFLHFNRNDGLQENEFNTNTSFETGDGELFFGGVNGTSSFYPERVTSYSEKPGVLLRSLFVNEKPWKNDTACWSLQQLSLPYYNKSIVISLAAIGNRTAEQYNYQYQLVNHDPGWVNAGSNPVIRYVLQPGKYIFRYYAGNSFVKEPADVKEMVIIIRPPFWKTTWFMVSLSLLLLLLIIAITRYISQVKLKRKIAELEQKRLMDEERLRISREMHDDIGAGLTQITLLSEAAKNTPREEMMMDKIAAASRLLVNSMSTIIWSMNSSNSSLDQLMAYLREQLDKQLEYTGLAYTIEFTGPFPPRELSNAQRRNLLLVSREIVNNVIRHSGAKKLIIQGNIHDDTLTLVFRDDGTGFDTAKTTSGNGLRNIRHRISELQGTIKLTSSGTGTSILLSVPV